MTTLDRLEHFMQIWRHTNVSLNPPASAAQIEAAEKAMHVRLPAEVRAAYLRFNGVRRDEYSNDAPRHPSGPVLFVNCCDWIDLDSMVSLWRAMKQLEADFKAAGIWQDVPLNAVPPNRRACPVDWHPKWIPIGDSGHFDKVYIDLAPAKAGVRGQIVYGGRGFGPIVCATSFDNYLERFLDGVGSGKLVLNPGGYSWGTPSGTVVTQLADAEV